MSRVSTTPTTTTTTSRNKRKPFRTREEGMMPSPFSFISVSSSSDTSSNSCSHSQSTTPSSVHPTISVRPDHLEEEDNYLQKEGPQNNNDLELLQSWQEEAHWISFRSAVQDFVVKSKKFCHDTTSNEDDSNWEEEAMADLSPPSKQPCTASSTTTWNKEESSSSSPGSSTSSYDSALAETRMRLALAQAERDELEFALLQRNQR